MTWKFVTRPMRGVGYVAWNWQWRAIDERGDTRVSTRAFATYGGCVAAAGIHGFTGRPRPSGLSPFFDGRKLGPPGPETRRSCHAADVRGVS
jgi:hypothetical protein